MGWRGVSARLLRGHRSPYTGANFGCPRIPPHPGPPVYGLPYSPQSNPTAPTAPPPESNPSPKPPSTIGRQYFTPTPAHHSTPLSCRPFGTQSCSCGQVSFCLLHSS